VFRLVVTLESSELYLVDTVQVGEEDAPLYLRTLEEVGIPVMTAAGAALESCRSTHSGLGTDVDIEVVWRIGDLGHWNSIRRNLVLDPGWYRWARRAAGLRRGGTRRIMGDVLPGREA
jgi:hypothetical protein